MPRKRSHRPWHSISILVAVGAACLVSGSASAQPILQNATQSSQCPVFMRQAVSSAGSRSTQISGSLANAGPQQARAVVFHAYLLDTSGAVMEDYSTRVGNIAPGKDRSFKLSWKDRDLSKAKSRRDYGQTRLEVTHEGCTEVTSSDEANAIAPYRRKNLAAQERLAILRYRAAGPAVTQGTKRGDSAESRARRMPSTTAAASAEETQLLRYLQKDLPAEVTAAGLSPGLLIRPPR